MTLTPRGWQADPLPIVLRTLRSGRPALVSACTGAGKSIYLALLLHDVLGTLRDGWVVVVTVPTEALVEQLTATLAGVLGVSQVGRWYGRIKRQRTVTVCCLPSLTGLVEHLQTEGQRCALWVGDEVHRAEAYAETLDALAPRARLGLTATPYLSRTGLTMWPELTYRYSMDQAIRAGDLVPPQTHCWHGDETDVTPAILEMVRRLDVQGPGVISSEDVTDCEDAARWYTESGLSADPIHSRLSTRRRKALLERLQRGDVRALVHVRVLSEGVDLPWLRWLGLRAKGHRTRLGLVQEVGRGLRAYPGKTHAIVLDPLGLMESVGIIHAEDLVKIADDPDAEAREAREVQEREELARVELQTRRVDELAAWLDRVRWASMGRPVLVDSDGAVTEGQMARIRELSGATRWLDAADRERVRTLIEGSSLVTARTASALIDVLGCAKKHASTHKAQGRSWAQIPRLSLEDV